MTELSELGFTREKLRRELQEALNLIDTATTAQEGESADLVAAAQLFVVGKTVKDYTNAVIAYEKDQNDIQP